MVRPMVRIGRASTSSVLPSRLHLLCKCPQTRRTLTWIYISNLVPRLGPFRVKKKLILFSLNTDKPRKKLTLCSAGHPVPRAVTAAYVFQLTLYST